MSSRALQNAGLAVAGDDAGQEHQDFAPKGRFTKSTFVKSETTDIVPPVPAASSSAPVTVSTTTPAPPASAGTTTSSGITSVTTVPTTPPATTTPVSTPTDSSSTTPTTTPTSPIPSKTAGDAASGDPASKKVQFYYSVGSQATAADGIYSTMTIAKPTLAKGDYHSLAEMALQSADGSQAIEVGWTVDRLVNGDDDPHLFVFHWVNGQPTCYNACGFQPLHLGVDAGDTLPTDTAKKIGIQYIAGAWWIAYDTTWVGYFPDTIWSLLGTPFSHAGFFQVFGEVASFGNPPCTAMGNGIVPALNDAGAAKFGSIAYINGPGTNVDMYVRGTSDYYTTYASSNRTFRYGGPGCKAITGPNATPTPTDSSATTN